MFELLEAYGLLGIQHFASILLGFVRTKILAVTLGPYGVGIISQANAYFVMVQGFTALGLGGGFTKLVAEYHSQQDYERLNRTVVSLITLYGGIGILLLLICVPFSSQISIWTFADPNLGSYIVMIMAAGIFWIQYQTILLLFRGLLHWKEYSLASSLGYLINIIISVVLIYFLGLDGGVISILVAQISNLIVATIILHKRVAPLHKLEYWKYRPDRAAFKELIPYIAPSMAVNMLATFASVYIRGDIIRYLGAEANGIYQAVWGISLAYIGFILNATFVYGIPKVASQLREPAEMVKVQNNGLRIGILLLLPVSILLINTREIWIPLLYSSVFLVAGPMLFWQFAADLLRMLHTNFNVVLYPLNRLWFLFIDGVFYWGGWIVLSALALPKLGVAAVPISYFVVNLIAIILAYFYHKLTTTFQIYKENQILLFKTVIVLGMGYLTALYVNILWVRLILCASILSLLVLWLPRRDEIEKLFLFFNRYRKQNQ